MALARRWFRAPTTCQRASRRLWVLYFYEPLRCGIDPGRVILAVVVLSPSVAVSIPLVAQRQRFSPTRMAARTQKRATSHHHRVGPALAAGPPRDRRRSGPPTSGDPTDYERPGDKRRPYTTIVFPPRHCSFLAFLGADCPGGTAIGRDGLAPTGAVFQGRVVFCTVMHSSCLPMIHSGSWLPRCSAGLAHRSSAIAITASRPSSATVSAERA